MENTIPKEEIEKMMNLKGKARGMAIKGEAEFILHEKGEEGLKRLEEEMAKLGCPVDYRKMKAMSFYPVKYEGLTTLILKEVFNFSDDDFRKAGIFESKISFILRMFLRYFYSIKSMAKEASKIWEKYYDFGSLTVKELDEEKKQGVLVVKDFNHHPCYCRTLEGFIGSIVAMITNTDVVCREVKCPHWGHEHHEYLLKW